MAVCTSAATRPVPASTRGGEFSRPSSIAPSPPSAVPRESTAFGLSPRQAAIRKGRPERGRTKRRPRYHRRFYWRQRRAGRRPVGADPVGDRVDSRLRFEDKEQLQAPLRGSACRFHTLAGMVSWAVTSTPPSGWINSPSTHKMGNPWNPTILGGIFSVAPRASASPAGYHVRGKGGRSCRCTRGDVMSSAVTRSTAALQHTRCSALPLSDRDDGGNDGSIRRDRQWMH